MNHHFSVHKDIESKNCIFTVGSEACDTITLESSITCADETTVGIFAGGIFGAVIFVSFLAFVLVFAFVCLIVVPETIVGALK